MAETTYIAAVDDSGSSDPLYNRKGQYVPTSAPHVAAGYLALRTDYVEAFTDKWTALRQDIQAALDTPYLPPIHQRLMYGRSRPDDLRKNSVANPYLDVPHDQICEWIRAGYKIIRPLAAEPYVLAAYTFLEHRKNLAAGIASVIESPQALAEHRLIKLLSKGAYRPFRNRLVSPLIPLVCSMLIQMNNVMSLVPRTGSLSIQFDQFADSKGFDTHEILDVLHTQLDLRHIHGAHIVSNYDEEALMQACDMLLFFHKRFYTPETSTDPFLQDASIPTHGFFPAKRLRRNRYLIDQLDTHKPNAVTTLHYAVVYQEVYSRDPNFATEYLITPKEMKARLDQLSASAPTGPSYVSLLKDPSLANEYKAGNSE